MLFKVPLPNKPEFHFSVAILPQRHPDEKLLYLIFVIEIYIESVAMQKRPLLFVLSVLMFFILFNISNSSPLLLPNYLTSSQFSTLMSSLPKIPGANLASIIPPQPYSSLQLSPSQLSELVPKLDPLQLGQLTPVLNPSQLSGYTSLLNVQQVTDIIPQVSTSTLSNFVPDLSTAQLTGSIPQLDSFDLTQVPRLTPYLTTSQIIPTLPQLSSTSLANLVPSLTNSQLGSYLSYAQPTDIQNLLTPYITMPQLNNLLPNLPIEQIDKLVPSLNGFQISQLAPQLSSILNTQQLSNLVTALNPSQLSALIPQLSTSQITAMLPSLNSLQISQIAPYLSNFQLNTLIPELSVSQLSQIAPFLNSAQLNNLINQLPTSELQSVLNSVNPSALASLLPELGTSELAKVVPFISSTIASLIPTSIISSLLGGPCKSLPFLFGSSVGNCTFIGMSSFSTSYSRAGNGKITSTSGSQQEFPPMSVIRQYNNNTAQWLITCPVAPNPSLTTEYFVSQKGSHIGGDACLAGSSPLTTEVYIYGSVGWAPFAWANEPYFDPLFYVGIVSPAIGTVDNLAYSGETNINGETAYNISNGYNSNSYIFNRVNASVEEGIWSWNNKFANFNNVDLSKTKIKTTQKLVYLSHEMHLNVTMNGACQVGPISVPFEIYYENSFSFISGTRVDDMLEKVLNQVPGGVTDTVLSKILSNVLGPISSSISTMINSIATSASEALANYASTVLSNMVPGCTVYSINVKAWACKYDYTYNMNAQINYINNANIPIPSSPPSTASNPNYIVVGGALHPDYSNLGTGGWTSESCAWKLATAHSDYFTTVAQYGTVACGSKTYELIIPSGATVNYDSHVYQNVNVWKNPSSTSKTPHYYVGFSDFSSTWYNQIYDYGEAQGPITFNGVQILPYLTYQSSLPSQYSSINNQLGFLNQSFDLYSPHNFQQPGNYLDPFPLLSSSDLLVSENGFLTAFPLNVTSFSSPNFNGIYKGTDSFASTVAYTTNSGTMSSTLMQNVLAWSNYTDRAAITSNVPAYLIDAIMAKESGGNKMEVNYNTGGSVDAGLMQVNSANWPSNWQGATISQISAWQINSQGPWNPQWNVNTGATILENYLYYFNGDFFDGVAAYNAGPGSVSSGDIPKITVQTYVPTVLEYMRAFQNGVGITEQNNPTAVQQLLGKQLLGGGTSTPLFASGRIHNPSFIAESPNDYIFVLNYSSNTPWWICMAQFLTSTECTKTSNLYILRVMPNGYFNVSTLQPDIVPVVTNTISVSTQVYPPASAAQVTTTSTTVPSTTTILESNPSSNQNIQVCAVYYNKKTEATTEGSCTTSTASSLPAGELNAFENNNCYVSDSAVTSSFIAAECPSPQCTFTPAGGTYCPGGIKTAPSTSSSPSTSAPITAFGGNWIANWKTYWNGTMAAQSFNIYITSAFQASSVTSGIFGLSAGIPFFHWGHAAGTTTLASEGSINFFPTALTSDYADDVFWTGEDMSNNKLVIGRYLPSNSSFAMNTINTPKGYVPGDELAASPGGTYLYLANPIYGNVLIFNSKNFTFLGNISLSYSNGNAISSTFRMNISKYLAYGGPYNSISVSAAYANAITSNDVASNHHPIWIGDSNGVLYVLDNWTFTVQTKHNGALSSSILMLRAFLGNGTEVKVDPFPINTSTPQVYCTISAYKAASPANPEAVGIWSCPSDAKTPQCNVVQSATAPAGGTPVSGLANYWWVCPSGTTPPSCSFSTENTGCSVYVGSLCVHSTSEETGITKCSAKLSSPPPSVGAYPPYGWPLSAALSYSSSGSEVTYCAYGCSYTPSILAADVAGGENKQSASKGYLPIGPAITNIPTSTYSTHIYMSMDYNDTAYMIATSNTVGLSGKLMSYKELLAFKVQAINYTAVANLANESYVCLVNNNDYSTASKTSGVSASFINKYGCWMPTSDKSQFAQTISQMNGPILGFPNPMKFVQSQGSPNNYVSLPNAYTSVPTPSNKNSNQQKANSIVSSCKSSSTSSSLCQSSTSTLPSSLVAAQPTSPREYINSSISGYYLIPYTLSYTVNQIWTLGAGTPYVQIGGNAGCPAPANGHQVCFAGICPASIISGSSSKELINPPPPNENTNTVISGYAIDFTKPSYLNTSIEGGPTYLRYMSLENNFYIPNLSDQNLILPPEFGYRVFSNRLFGEIYINQSVSPKKTTQLSQMLLINQSHMFNYVIDTFTQNGQPAYETETSYINNPAYVTQNPGSGFSDYFTSGHTMSGQTSLLYSNGSINGDAVSFQQLIDTFYRENYLYNLTLNMDTNKNIYGYNRLIYVAVDRFNNTIYTPLDVDLANITVLTLQNNTVINPANPNQTEVTVSGYAGYYTSLFQETPIPIPKNSNIYLYYDYNINYYPAPSTSTSGLGYANYVVGCQFNGLLKGSCPIANPLNTSQTEQINGKPFSDNPLYYPNYDSSGKCPMPAKSLLSNGFLNSLTECNIYTGSSSRYNPNGDGAIQYCVPNFADGSGTWTSQIGLIGIAKTDSNGYYSYTFTACGTGSAKVIASYYGWPPPEPQTFSQNPLSDAMAAPQYASYKELNYSNAPNQTSTSFPIGSYALNFGIIEIPLAIVMALALLLLLRKNKK